MGARLGIPWKRLAACLGAISATVTAVLPTALACAQGGASATDPRTPAAEVVGDVTSDEIKLDVERFGVAGVARPGEWIGVRVVVQDSAPRPRELVLQLSTPDIDGDQPQQQRDIASNPGVRQGTWMYMRLPAGFKPGDPLVLSAFEGVDAGRSGVSGLLQPGRLLARSRVTTRTLVSSVTGIAGVIGNRAFGLTRLGLRLGTEEFAPFGHELTRVESNIVASELPDRWMGLAQFEFLVWGGGDPGELRAERATAVREWIRRGGHLIIVLPAVGETWTNAGSTELTSLLPLVTIKRHEGVDLAPFRPIFADRVITGLPKDGVVHEFVPAADAATGEAERIICGPDGACVVARRLHGLGAVTLIGLDLNHPAFRDGERIDPAVFWNRVLGRRGPIVTQGDIDKRLAPSAEGFPSRNAVRFDGDIAEQIAKSRRATAGVLLGFIVFAVYWLIAGPGGFALLKKRGMVRHAWLGYVAAAGLFTVVAWGGASIIRPKHVEGSHLTIIDHVFGQPTERARVWMSLLVPKYGSATLRIGEANSGTSSNDSTDAVAPWEPPPDQVGVGGSFPDVRGYQVDTRSPSALTFPTRSTVKQVQIDWSGGPPWKMPSVVSENGASAPIVMRQRRTGEQSWLIGSLAHELPRELRDVLVIVVPGQREIGRGVLSTRTVADARAFVVESWPSGPDGALDLARVTVEKSGADTTLMNYLRNQLIRFGAGRFVGDEKKLDLTSASDRMLIVGLLSQFAPPDPGATKSDTWPWATRQNTHGMDLGRWMSQPCVIIMGTLGDSKEGSPCPVPMTLDGEKFEARGRTIVRWIYPLSDDPPTFAANEPAEPAESAPSLERGK